MTCDRGHTCSSSGCDEYVATLLDVAAPLTTTLAVLVCPTIARMSTLRSE